MPSNAEHHDRDLTPNQQRRHIAAILAMGVARHARALVAAAASSSITPSESQQIPQIPLELGGDSRLHGATGSAG